jgi:glutathione S-transferase
VLTEWPAIAYYLANKFPAAGLLPDDLEAAADAVSTAEYIVSTMHMQAFTRIYRPERFSAIADEHAAIRATGLQMFGEGLELLSQRLGDGAFLVGERLSIADTALLFVVFWAKRGEFPIPANVAALFERLKQRPAIRAVFEKEGLPL